MYETYEIAPSILAADFNCLGKQLRELSDHGIRILHIDVMDGVFVPSISFGLPVVASIRSGCDLFFDVHLMIVEPERYIKDFIAAGADSITVHIEACGDLEKTIDLIHDSGAECGVAINPETEIERIYPFLEKLQMVLVMSVRPGFGGQEFRKETLEKVRKLMDIKKEKGFPFKIEVDGGVNKQNLRTITESGVDILVSGTAVFSGNISDNLREMGR